MSMNSMCWNDFSNPSSLFFVKALGSLLAQGSKNAKLLQDGLNVIVGRSDRVKSWSDIKVEEIPLKEIFPIIYALVVNKRGSLRDYSFRDGNEWIWEITLRRPCFQ